MIPPRFGLLADTLLAVVSIVIARRRDLRPAALALAALASANWMLTLPLSPRLSALLWLLWPAPTTALALWTWRVSTKGKEPETKVPSSRPRHPTPTSHVPGGVPARGHFALPHPGPGAAPLAQPSPHPFIGARPALSGGDWRPECTTIHRVVQVIAAHTAYALITALLPIAWSADAWWWVLRIPYLAGAALGITAWWAWRPLTKSKRPTEADPHPRPRWKRSTSLPDLRQTRDATPLGAPAPRRVQRTHHHSNAARTVQQVAALLVLSGALDVVVGVLSPGAKWSTDLAWMTWIAVGIALARGMLDNMRARPDIEDAVTREMHRPSKRPRDEQKYEWGWEGSDPDEVAAADVAADALRRLPQYVSDVSRRGAKVTFRSKLDLDDGRQNSVTNAFDYLGGTLRRVR